LDQTQQQTQLSRSAEETQQVAVVILNYYRPEDTLACLDSLAASTYQNISILVLQMSADDPSIPVIQNNHPHAKSLVLDNNKGYAGNNNTGIRAVLENQPEWIFILNEDTVLAPDCLEKLVKVGQAQPVAGILGPMVYHYDEPDRIQSAGGMMDNLWRFWHAGQNQPANEYFTDVRAVDWVTGCSLLVRRRVIEEVGMMDEAFFMYNEETEWCLRAREAGWTIVHVPQARLWHKGVQRDYSPSASVTYYSFRNRFLLFHKHRAPFRARLAAWSEAFRTLASWSLQPKWAHMRQQRDALFQALWDTARRKWGQRET
jgi:GT2 family glycosyltransferase